MHFSDLGIFLGNISLWEIDLFTKDPMKSQRHLLKKIVNRNKNCEYGKKIHLKDVHSIEDYQRIVPLSTYDDYAPYVDRMINNREDRLMFSGRNIRYCSSSGSVGKPKSFERFRIQAASCAAHDAYDRLDRIACPTLVIGGKDDRIVTGRASEEIAERIPGCRLFMYEGLGHGLYEEAPDFLRRVSAFCGQARA